MQKIEIVRWVKVKSKINLNSEYVIETNGVKFRITQIELGGNNNITRHYSCSKLEYGQLVNYPLDMETSNTVLERVGSFGHTEAFIINQFEHELSDMELMEQIVHTKSVEEKAYTSTGDKLNYHWPIFKKFKETGFGSIIRATMTLHQVCSSKCQFCSTIGRNKKDSISLDEAISFVNKLYFDQEKFNELNFGEYNSIYKDITGSGIRLKGLILSGGGQPNLWPHFEKFVEYLSTTDIELGLITNGFPQNISNHIYDKFKWIRLSVTPPDASSFYPDGDFRRQYLPNTIGMGGQTVGLSYVYGPWTSDAEIVQINEFAVKNKYSYVRVLTDCNLSRIPQLVAHKSLSAKLLELKLIDAKGNPLSKTFHQLKFHSNVDEAKGIWDDGQCKLQLYNAFWDTTDHEVNGFSYIFPCDSVTVLSEGEGKASERKFNYETWGTYKNTEVENLFNRPVSPFFDPKEKCTACLFVKNNIIANNLIHFERPINTNIKPDHVNFP